MNYQKIIASGLDSKIRFHLWVNKYDYFPSVVKEQFKKERREAKERSGKSTLCFK